MDSRAKGGRMTIGNSTLPPPPPPPPPSRAAVGEPSDIDEIQRLNHAKPSWKNKNNNNNNKKLTKQLSAMSKTERDMVWEKRRRQISKQEKKRSVVVVETTEDITDEDLHELKGSIELGFGFNEQGGQQLCNTLPALDLYFAVNRQLSLSPVSTPNSQSHNEAINVLGRSSSQHDSPRCDDSWKICSPGDNPQQVKTRLRHWAQAVACSVRQSF